MTDYIEAKSRIFINQTPEDDAVLNGDDPIVMKLAERVKAKRVLLQSEGEGEPNRLL